MQPHASALHTELQQPTSSTSPEPNSVDETDKTNNCCCRKASHYYGQQHLVCTALKSRMLTSIPNASLRSLLRGSSMAMVSLHSLMDMSRLSCNCRTAFMMSRHSFLACCMHVHCVGAWHACSTSNAIQYMQHCGCIA